MAIISLLLAGVLLVYWWRSTHGHTDTYTWGKGSANESRFTAAVGRIAVEVVESRGSVVSSRMQFYPFKDVLGYLLIVPGLWAAIKVRGLLPRPPGREVLPRDLR